MPRRGTRPGNVRGASSGGRVRLEWDTRKVIDQVGAIEQEAMQRVQARAESYWHGQEWTPERHPYMTGDEASIEANGYFRLARTEQGTVALYVGSDSEHTIYEEAGTGHQPAHHPIRNTVDHVAYSISDELRRAAARHQGEQ